MIDTYQPLRTKVLDVITETPTIKTLVLKPPKPIPFNAGQFMQLTIFGIGEAPFTPSSSPFDAEKMEMKTGTDSAHVWFAELTDRDINWYLSTGEWNGAAGAYRIQEMGECLVERIEGSCSNIMGLPIRLFFSILLSAGYPAYNLPSGRFPD